MNPRKMFSLKRVVILATILIAAVALTALLALRRPARVPMDRYVPATALAFMEMDSLPDVVTGLTDTKAWRELAPALGISSQLRQVGFAAQLVGRTGIGPEQAVVTSRAQMALAVTDIEAEAGGEEGSTNVKPQFALLVETHASPTTTSGLLSDLASVLARRVYGEATSQHSEDYQGTSLLIFQGPKPERQLVAAASGSIALVGNHISAIKACLDTIAGRAPAISEDSSLKQMRSRVDHNSALFAYVTEAGIEKMVSFASAIVSTRFTADPDRISSIASLFGHMSKQTTAGLFYGAEFESGGVTERYLTALRLPVAERLAQALKPGPVSGPEALAFIPPSVQDFTVLSAEAGGALPERVLKELSPQLDIVAGLALREFVVSFRKQLGLEGGDSLGDAVAGDIVFMRFNEDAPTAMILRIKDRTVVSPILNRYLTRDHASLSSSQHNGIEITTSTHRDGRSAAFIRDFLILGTREQLTGMIDAEASGQNMLADARIRPAFAARPPAASIISYKPEAGDAGEMMLAISRLTRVTDGSRELLDQDSIKQAIARLQPSVTFTEFRPYGVYNETRSATGNFSFIGSVVGNEE